MYANMVNLIVMSMYIYITMWQHCILDCVIFNIAKFMSLTLLSLLILYKFSFPIPGLKLSSLPILVLKSNKIVMWHLQDLLNTRSISRRSYPSYNQFYPLPKDEHLE